MPRLFSGIMRSDYRLLRLVSWLIALAIGAIDAWNSRFIIYPDGVSYLDIGDAYWRADWRSAINPFWSPLYSWILGFFVKLLRPSMKWEYPLVHLVNFLIYVAALAAFDFILRTFVSKQRLVDGDSQHKLSPVPESCWWMLGYSIFIASAVILIRNISTTPDMLVAALVYLASAIVLRIGTQQVMQGTYVWLGVVLGLAYLAKAVMFPIGLVFLLSALLADRKKLRSVALSAIVFVTIAAPFILAISISKHKFTIGESGRFQYLVFSNEVRPFYPNRSAPTERPSPFAETPVIHPLSHTTPGTYPPWWDASYWQDGIKTRFDLRNQYVVIGTSLRSYWQLFSVTQLGQLTFLIGVVIFAVLGQFKLRSVEWTLVVTPFLAFTIYGLLVVQFRYIGPFVAVIWIAIFDAFRFRSSREMRRILKFTVATLMTATMLVVLSIIVISATLLRSPGIWRAAEVLEQQGFQAGDPMALVWNEDAWMAGAAEGAAIPRLLKSHVIAEAEPSGAFWRAAPEVQAQVLRALHDAGAKAVLAGDLPADAHVSPCWHRLDETVYSVCMLNPQ